jgi:hypothetical protein
MNILSALKTLFADAKATPVTGDLFLMKDSEDSNIIKEVSITDFTSAFGGGLTNFTEANTVAAPNATIPVDSFTAVDAGANADFAIIPKGTGSVLAAIPDNLAAGGNKRGIYSVDLQTFRSAATEVASGTYSVIGGGYRNTASNNYATVGGGYQNLSSGLYSFTSGYSNTATDQGATSLGYDNASTAIAATSAGSGNIVSAQSAVAIGFQNTVSGNYGAAFNIFNVISGAHSFGTGRGSKDFGIEGRVVHTSRSIAVVGDSQTSKMTLNNSTTDDTTTVLTTNAGAASTVNQLILQNNNSIRFKGYIVGRKSGTTDTAAWDIDGFIQRGASAATTTLIVSNVTVVDNTPAWGTPTLAADTSNGGLKVDVTGLAGTNIRWTAFLQTAEVIYA